MPDWLNSSNLVAAAAFTALVASQFPPFLPRIVGHFRPPSVSVSTSDSFGLTHHLGRFYILAHARLENRSVVPITVGHIECVIQKVEKTADSQKPIQWRMPARQYVSLNPVAPGYGPTSLFIGTIHLDSGSAWQEVVQCYGHRGEEREERAIEIVSKFQSAAREELQRRSSEGDSQQMPIEFDQGLVTEAQTFARESLDLTKGEYFLFLSAFSSEGKVIGASKYRFVLYESSISALVALFNDYSLGLGILGAHYLRQAIIEPRLQEVTRGKAAIRDFRTAIA